MSTRTGACPPVVKRAELVLVHRRADVSASVRDEEASKGLTPVIDDAHSHRLATLGELTASILHQVNGPLTYLLLNLERLEVNARDGATRETVRAAREGAELIRDIARDVTLLARGGGRASSIVNVGDVVRAAVRIAGARLRFAAQLFEETSAVPLVRADPTRLLQVVVNVLLNAADACEASGLSGRAVRVTLATDAQGDAALSIVDNADGLGPEDSARVFLPFFTTKAPGKGTGLGLALAKQIVEDAGGRITFESTRGAGTSVRIVLPAVRNGAPHAAGDPDL